MRYKTNEILPPYNYKNIVTIFDKPKLMLFKLKYGL